MANKDTPSQALDKIMAQSQEIFKITTLRLYNDLKSLKVIDTGHFRNSWGLLQISKEHYQISNTADYASILARGRRRFRNSHGTVQWYGSLDWYNGLSPMLAKANHNMDIQFKQIKE